MLFTPLRSSASSPELRKKLIRDLWSPQERTQRRSLAAQRLLELELHCRFIPRNDPR